MDAESPYLAPLTAASYLGVSAKTLEAWRIKGTGPTFYKVGRRVVYRREDLDLFVTERPRRSTSHGSA